MTNTEDAAYEDDDQRELTAGEHDEPRIDEASLLHLMIRNDGAANDKDLWQCGLSFQGCELTLGPNFGEGESEELDEEDDMNELEDADDHDSWSNPRSRLRGSH